MKLAKAAPLLVVGLLLLGARYAVNLQPVDQAKEQKKYDMAQTAEKLRLLIEPCTFLLSEEDYVVMFPEQPRQDQFILIGSNDDDWHLQWRYDTTFEVSRTVLEGESDPAGADRILLRDAATRMIQGHNEDRAGKPDAWVVQQEREGMHLEMFPLREFTYSYRKYTTELPRAGRVWLIRTPSSMVTLQVDGEPDVVSSPLADSFLESFNYLPPLK